MKKMSKKEYKVGDKVLEAGYRPDFKNCPHCNGSYKKQAWINKCLICLRCKTVLGIVESEIKSTKEEEKPKKSTKPKKAKA